MVKNALSDILFNWNKMSKSYKLTRLQDLENMVARDQGRKPRKVVLNPDMNIVKRYIGTSKCPAAFYSRYDKEHLYIIDDDCEPVEIVKNIIHEGDHAYFHDFVSGEVNAIKMFEKIDLEMFYIEEENLPAINREFEIRGLMDLFDSAYVEERVIHQDCAMRLLRMMFDLVESEIDAGLLYHNVLHALGYAYSNQAKIKDEERVNNVTYENVVIDALNKECDEKCKICKTGHVQQIKDEAFMRFYRKAMQSLKNLDNIRTSMLMDDLTKKRMEKQEGNNAMQAYMNYVIRLLREKKKG